MLEKTTQLLLLADFYSPMLTERQREMIELYYGGDYTLGEIAGELGVSRQAVHDLVRRAEKSLLEYEERLGLVARYQRDQEALEAVKAGLTEALAQTLPARAEEALHKALRDLNTLLSPEEGGIACSSRT